MMNSNGSEPFAFSLLRDIMDCRIKPGNDQLRGYAVRMRLTVPATVARPQQDRPFIEF
jgi:hypothetical protein